MSHFTVMVVGENVDELLAPYHEFECTGHNDEFVQNIDRTDEVRQEWEEYLHGDNDGSKLVLSFRDWLKEEESVEDHEFLRPDQTPDYDGDHKWGYYVLDQGELVKAVRRTNPNAKWDWYQVGGRWQGMLKLKPEYAEAMGYLAALESRGKTIPESLVEKCAGIAMGSPSLLMGGHKFNRFQVDQAPKGKIDFDGMIQDHLNRIMPTFDAIQEAIGGREWETWSEVRESERFKGDIDSARKHFNSQPVVEAIKEVLKGQFFIDWEEFKKDRDTYMQEQRLNAVSTFALLKDGEWLGQGEMGWFGMSDDKMEKATWYEQQMSIIESLSDDTLITIVDCHI